MPFETAAQTTIDAPRHEVWRYLTDFSRHTEWSEPKHEQTIQPPREVSVGATFSSVGKDMGKAEKNEVTITEVVPNERIAYVANMVGKGMVWRNAFEFADAGSGTRVTKRETLVRGRFPYNAMIAILGPVLRIEGQKLNTADLARIKTRLERRQAEVA